jgi:hypothetical protein
MRGTVPHATLLALEMVAFLGLDCFSIGVARVTRFCSNTVNKAFHVRVTWEYAFNF